MLFNPVDEAQFTHHYSLTMKLLHAARFVCVLANDLPHSAHIVPMLFREREGYYDPIRPLHQIRSRKNRFT